MITHRALVLSLVFAAPSALAQDRPQPLADAEAFLEGVEAAQTLQAERDGHTLYRGVELESAPPVRASLEAWQTPIKDQAGRGTCWAFAGVAALEAAYKRSYGIDLDLSEQYVFHMTKAGELYTDYLTSSVPHENNSSFWGFQGNSGILESMERFGVPTEADAPYLSDAAMTALRDSLPAAGTLAPGSSQDALDALEFAEGHVPSRARERASYRVTRAESVAKGDTTALETLIAGGHEVVADFNLKWRLDLRCACYVYDEASAGGGHVLLLVGYDREQDWFLAKNSWGETDTLRLSYDFVRRAMSWGHYIAEVAPPSAGADVRAKWLGRWHMDHDGWIGELVIRRFTGFRNADADAPTKVGTYYRDGVAYDVNGYFMYGGRTLVYYVAATAGRKPPGELAGQSFEAHLMGREYGSAGGVTNADGTLYGVRLSRWAFTPGPASGFHIGRWISAFDMSHDGWQGRLSLTDYSYVRPSSSAPYWEIRGTYKQPGRDAIPVSGRAYEDRPHALRLTIPFSAEHRQPFDLYYHTWEIGVFSGITYWEGAPFGVVGR